MEIKYSFSVEVVVDFRDQEPDYRHRAAVAQEVLANVRIAFKDWKLTDQHVKDVHVKSSEGIYGFCTETRQYSGLKDLGRSGGPKPVMYFDLDRGKGVPVGDLTILYGQPRNAGKSSFDSMLKQMAAKMPPTEIVPHVRTVPEQDRLKSLPRLPDITVDGIHIEPKSDIEFVDDVAEFNSIVGLFRINEEINRLYRLNGLLSGPPGASRRHLGPPIPHAGSPSVNPNGDPYAWVQVVNGLPVQCFTDAEKIAEELLHGPIPNLYPGAPVQPPTSSVARWTPSGGGAYDHDLGPSWVGGSPPILHATCQKCVAAVPIPRGLPQGCLIGGCTVPDPVGPNGGRCVQAPSAAAIQQAVDEVNRLTGDRLNGPPVGARVCTCDIRDLMTSGHLTGCPEKKK